MTKEERLKGTILPADLHPNIPQEAKWLSGQGEGTWFVVTKEKYLNEQQYRVRRFSPQGNLECDRLFELNDLGFDINRDFEIAHVSHCAIVRVKQAEKVFKMEFKKEFNVTF